MSRRDFVKAGAAASVVATAPVAVAGPTPLVRKATPPVVIASAGRPRRNAQAAAAAIASGLAENAGIAVCDQPTDDCELVVNSRMVALIAYLQRLGRVPQGKSLATADTKEVAR